MPSSVSRVATIVVATLVFFSLSVTPAAFAPRKALVDRRARYSGIDGFRIELKRVDHGKNLTKFERLQRAIARSNNRLEKLNLMSLSAQTSGAIKAPIHPGEGEFLVSTAVGTPPVPFSAIVDTGSDLIWTQCRPCNQCYHQPTPVFDPAKSSSFARLPCSSPLCAALPSPACDDRRQCTYSYEYGDYSSTSGDLASDTFTFSPTLKVPHLVFGCGYDNEGPGFDQGGGLVGLGRGPLSLVSQLDEPKFSYCLSAIADDGTSKGSSLRMGSLATAKNTSSVVTTPLVRSVVQASFYYLNLEAISVGGARLRIPRSTFRLKPNGSGGLIIDSGTTITYLEERAYNAVRREFASRINLKQASDGAQKAGLDLCFHLSKKTAARGVQVPALAFHFEGAAAPLELPPENYMVALGGEKEPLMCLAMGSANGMSVLGNIQQQNFEVLYDVDKEILSFFPTKCDA